MCFVGGIPVWGRSVYPVSVYTVGCSVNCMTIEVGTGSHSPEDLYWSTNPRVPIRVKFTVRTRKVLDLGLPVLSSPDVSERSLCR